ncbi:hypothetical protein PN4B1_16560 [Paenibacillus naphthalenovorans]|nr:hypothetical protein PN4B1_16560 [Paenibacillus naphthalenovorans]
MKKDILFLTRENLIKLGIDPKEGIEYLETKKAITVNPSHVKALDVLKQRPAVPSS